ncbi:MAG: spore coat protein [Acidobacteriota bacterium]
MNNKLGVHEQLELHELLNMKATCVSKSASMANLASDNDLKQLLQQDVKAGQQHLNDLQSILKTSM